MRTHYIDFYTKRAAEQAALCVPVHRLPYVQALSGCRFQLRLLAESEAYAERVIQIAKGFHPTDSGVIFVPKRNHK